MRHKRQIKQRHSKHFKEPVARLRHSIVQLDGLRQNPPVRLWQPAGCHRAVDDSVFPLPQLQHFASRQGKWIGRRENHSSARIALHPERAFHIEKIARIRIRIDRAVIRQEMLIVGTAVDHHVPARVNLAGSVVVRRLVRMHDVVAVVNHHIAVQRVEVPVRQRLALLIVVNELHGHTLRRLRHDARFRQAALQAGIVGQIVDAGWRSRRCWVRLRRGKLCGYCLRPKPRMQQQIQRDTPKQAGSHCARQLQHNKGMPMVRRAASSPVWFDTFFSDPGFCLDKHTDALPLA